MEWKVSQGPVSYEDAVAAMDERAAAVHDGRESEMVWLLEHPPLYTAGTSAKSHDLLNPQFPVFKSGRGGQYTYHGPGQRIAYVMLDLKSHHQKPDIKQYVCDLEQWIIGTLQEFDVRGERRAGRIGIWVDTPQGEKKIAAIGVRVRRWVTLHGVSINVSPDLSHYGEIIPCGISTYGVTSLKELGVGVSMEELDKSLRKGWDKVF